MEIKFTESQRYLFLLVIIHCLLNPKKIVQILGSRETETGDARIMPTTSQSCSSFTLFCAITVAEKQRLYEPKLVCREGFGNIIQQVYRTNTPILILPYQAASYGFIALIPLVWQLQLTFIYMKLIDLQLSGRLEKLDRFFETPDSIRDRVN